MPQRVCGISSLETVRSHLNMVLGNLLWEALLEYWGWTRELSEIPSKHNHSAILWFLQQNSELFWANSQAQPKFLGQDVQ